ncbi:uronate isomerase [Klebsiella michiganensis]|nr:uronate isomerase [Klebsiella michiganensis]
MQQMNVKMVGTTDDPVDSLEHHASVAKDSSFSVKVLPSWRPDKAFNIEQATFNDYMAKLGEVSDPTFAALPTPVRADQTSGSLRRSRL